MYCSDCARGYCGSGFNCCKAGCHLQGGGCPPYGVAFSCHGGGCPRHEVTVGVIEVAVLVMEVTIVVMEVAVVVMELAPKPYCPGQS